VTRRESARAHPSSLTSLARLAQAGSAPELDCLLRRVEKPVYRYLVSRLVAAPDAEDLARDLCQEALIRATTSPGRCTFDSDGRLLAWVLTIARNVLLDHLRHARVHPELRADVLWERAVAAAPQPGDETAASQLLEALAAEALSTVPEATAELLRLRLRLVAGRSWKEVAEALGIAKTAARRRFQCAQITLRRHILAQVDELPPAARRLVSSRLL
jgi:RNA polymerase sigma-70 factor (ECF subfamily)